MIVIVVGLLIWGLVRRTRFGTAIYSVGSDPEASHAVGISVRWTRFWAFVLGGLFYGAAGVFIGAQTGSADPLVGDPLLLQSFTAVVLGGTLLGGGRGGALGSVVGAYTLLLMINILSSALDVSAYFSTIAEGLVLILAVVGASIGQESVAVRSFASLATWLRARAAGSLAPQAQTGIERPMTAGVQGGKQDGVSSRASWLQRNAEQLRYVLPAYVAFILVVIATQIVYQYFYGESIVFSVKYYDSLVVLGAFLAITSLLAKAESFSRAASICPGSVDAQDLLAAGLIPGSNLATIWVVPLVLAVGAFIGLCNGLGALGSRAAGDRGHARDQRHPAGDSPAVQQRHAERLRVSRAALVDDRPLPRHHAGRDPHGDLCRLWRSPYSAAPFLDGGSTRSGTARAHPYLSGVGVKSDSDRRLCLERTMRRFGGHAQHRF